MQTPRLSAQMPRLSAALTHHHLLPCQALMLLAAVSVAPSRHSAAGAARAALCQPSEAGLHRMAAGQLAAPAVAAAAAAAGAVQAVGAAPAAAQA